VLTHSHHHDRHLERFQARKVEITAHAPLPREVDGEVITHGRTLTVAVRPAALTVRVPAGRQLAGKEHTAGHGRLEVWQSPSP
jgi:diacylglycerol kinase family enzyme